MTLGVPCRNAEATLSHVLAAVEAQSERPRRLVCVDDFSDDDTSILLQERDSVELHRHHRRRGPAATRNAVLEVADTEYVAIVDDDVRVGPDWLATLVAAIEDGDAALVGGTISEAGDGPAARWRDRRAPHDPYEDPGAVPWVDPGAILARTDALRAVGGWPEATGDGAGVERAWPAAHERLCARLRAAGETVSYEPAAEATHLGEESAGAALRAAWRTDLDASGGVESAGDVVRRLRRHFGTAAGYLREDVAERRWSALPISARVPVAFPLYDVRYLRGGGEPAEASGEADVVGAADATEEADASENAHATGDATDDAE